MLKIILIKKFYLLYADDLQVYVQVSPENINDAIEKLSLAAHDINIWAQKVSKNIRQYIRQNIRQKHIFRHQSFRGPIRQT